MTSVRTVGHGTLTAEAFVSLLHGADVSCTVEERAVLPGEPPQPAVRPCGDGTLGPTVRPRLRVDSSNLAGAVDRAPGPSTSRCATRCSAPMPTTWTQSPSRQGWTNFLAGAVPEPTAVLCSESLWWRCHRRLLADYLVLVAQSRSPTSCTTVNRLPTPTTGVAARRRRPRLDVGVTPSLPDI